MLTKNIAEPHTFRETTEDLVLTIQEAVRTNELDAADKEWLIGELDQLIEGLKSAKQAQIKAKNDASKKPSKAESK